MISYNLNLKFLYIIKIVFIFSIICIKSYADTTKTKGDLIVLGKHNAPVKIKIFSSLTCPHCASFHKEIVSEIKKEYVESGQVQLIFIDFPLDQSAFNASKLLHCLDQNKQLKFLDTIYENQEEWVIGSNIDQINNNLKKIVQNLGISPSKFDKCLNDEIIADKILNGRISGQQKYSINATPTIIINEKKFEDSVSFENIKKKIEKLI